MAKIADFSIMLFPWGVKNPSVGEIVEAAKLCERLGFHSVSLPMHLTMPTSWLFPKFPNRDVLDPLVVLPAMVAATSTIKVGFNSALLPLLPPYEWAKYLATLDVMSGGRVIAGVAMGWWEEEFQVAGSELKARGQMFDEQLEIITSLWTRDRTTFQGRHYNLVNAPLEPKPVQKPHPPIWIGGGMKSIKRAARYAEYIVPFWPTAEQARNEWIPRLREEGARAGTCPKLGTFTFAYVAGDEGDFQARLPMLRDCAAFEDPSTDPLEIAIAGTPEVCARNVKTLEAAGISHFLIDFQFHGLESVPFMMEQMETFVREVVPLL